MTEEDKEIEIDPDVLGGYSPFDINVVPVIKPVSGFESPADDDGFNPPPIQSQTPGGFQDGMYNGELGGEVTTLEDCQSLSHMVWNLPGMFLGEHLERSEEQTDKFGKELYKYCSKKGIDPSDYVFDEFALVVSATMLGSGLWRDHKDHKRGKLIDAKTGEGDFDSTSGSSEKYTPVEEKVSEYDASSGTNLPEEEIELDMEE